MSKSKDVDVYLQGELCAKAELATKLLHDIAWSKWTTDAMTARAKPIYKQAKELNYWLLNSDEWYTENEDGSEDNDR
ncbi:hypothetical protein [Lacticaseibacillus paracasei]|uniref:hypothetical protein n=1 Tax=Lacticaseibacillus paracasei TaxID=1597 RepID=UPI0002977B98|nr:hypothetical protein [Lacticaseibacillus paracasei]EKQ10712.1 hypothetical protein LCAM36_0591 [Lacticaseibacillus paracasei]MCZ2766850.1 hypothetical protein [Lacticaseibacillus paracasei]MCZ2769796.1 hypothetical protein [Lacticaseibacillus paracasei]MCZ2775298.1 hypothetical protein [Lacticaseibacillus paracasei]MCZ2778220.1 hypothetical protein [Lacticaseibacillus paracasei]